MSEKTLSRSPRAVKHGLDPSFDQQPPERFGDQALALQERQHARNFLLEREGLHPLALDPEQLVLVVAGGRAVDPVEGELLDQLGPGEDLLRGVVAPAQPGQVVEQGLGEIALFDVLVKIDQDALLLVLGDLPLGQLRLRARLGDVRDVGERRQRRAQGLEDQELRERVREVLLGTDDVGDLHLDVVDDAGEVVERRAVGADDHEVADLVGRELDVPLDQVVEDERPARRDLEPQGDTGAPRPRTGRPAASVSALRRKR